MNYKPFAKLATLFVGSLMLLNTSVYAKTITDVAGREVTVPEKVDRILLGEGRFFHTVALLEGDKPLDRIAGWQGDFKLLDPETYAIYKAKYPEIDKIPLIGQSTPESVSPENALMLAPDVAIFGLSGHGPAMDSELVKQLEKAGVPVVFIDFRSAPLKNTVPSIRILGEVLHRETEAQRYIDFYQQNVEKVTSRIAAIPADKRRSIFIELKAGSSDSCCGTAGNGNMGDFIDLAGGNNISKPLLPSALGSVNLEKVLDADPQVYVMTGNKGHDSVAPGIKFGAGVTAEQSRESIKPVLERVGIRDLTAVKTGNAHALWHGYYNSAQNVLAIQAIAKWLYPDLFKDLDPNETRDTLFKEFLTVEPTGVYWLDNVQSVQK